MKYTCIIDACSYINLSNVENNRTNLLKILEKSVDLIFSSHVNKEIRDDPKLSMPTKAKRKNMIVSPKRYDFPEYEKRIFNTIRNPGKENQGEKDNFTITLDQYLSFRKVGLIYLTDDHNALRGSLINVIPSFPIFQVWSSYDVVLFLYIINQINNLQTALAAIRDVDNQIAPFQPGMKPERTQEKIKRVTEYSKRLDLINKVLY